MQDDFTPNNSVVADGTTGITFTSNLLSSGDKIRVTLTLSNDVIGDIEFYTDNMTVPS